MDKLKEIFSSVTKATTQVESGNADLRVTIPKVGYRAARFYNFKEGIFSVSSLPSLASSSSDPSKSGLGDPHPLEVASLIAGVAGITIIIIVILSIWILRRPRNLNDKEKMAQSQINTVRSNFEPVLVETVIVLKPQTISKARETEV